MVKTSQFTTKCKGDRVIALKWQKITLVGLRLECLAHPYQRSHVALLMVLFPTGIARMAIYYVIQSRSKQV